MQPVIGITVGPSVDALAHGTFTRYSLNEAYVAAVAEAGGRPIILPPVPGDPGWLLDLVDGLLFSGGADIDPTHFGDTEVHPATYGIDPARDVFELELVRRAITADVPVLGICRGIQVLNVALGGSLIQHVPDAAPDGGGHSHRQQEAGLSADAVGHAVAVVDHPCSQALLLGPTLGVNSFHHQAVRDLAPSLEAVAWSPDGLVEAVVRPASSFVAGVQWHPELMYRRDPVHHQPFAALVAAARAHRLTAARR